MGCSSPVLMCRDALAQTQRHLCKGCFGLRAQHKAGEAAAAIRAGGSSILHIALPRGFLPVGVKVSGEQSQRAEHMALVQHGARSCSLP